MNIASINNIGQLGKLGVNSSAAVGSSDNSFDSIFKSALNLVKETNDYTNAAQEAETSYALGLTDSTHDLQVAQQKANLALQYTVAIRNNVMDAYKEIMNLQF
ncbi:MAG: hypothetical protein K0R00_1724 [Herbinix sp.]|jgi:flagellar hook-basal body complex protein FliE|nr:hypothetical protein [Herbinix sp.]